MASKTYNRIRKYVDRGFRLVDWKFVLYNMEEIVGRYLFHDELWDWEEDPTVGFIGSDQVFE